MLLSELALVVVTVEEEEDDVVTLEEEEVVTGLALLSLSTELDGMDPPDAEVVVGVMVRCGEAEEEYAKLDVEVLDEEEPST